MLCISDKYINLNNSELYNILGIQINPSIHIYNKYYNDLAFNPEKINQIIQDFINSYIDEKYKILNLINADINYYIEHINHKYKIFVIRILQHRLRCRIQNENLGMYLYA